MGHIFKIDYGMRFPRSILAYWPVLREMWRRNVKIGAELPQNVPESPGKR